MTPDLAETERHDGARPRHRTTRWRVNGVRLQGDGRGARETDGSMLYRLAGPIRLAENQTGVAADGWMSEKAAYNRFDVTRRRPGLRARDAVARGVLHGGAVPSTMRFASGRSAIGAGQATGARVGDDDADVEVKPCESRTVLAAAAAGPVARRGDVDDVRPDELDPSHERPPRARARVDVGFQPLSIALARTRPRDR